MSDNNVNRRDFLRIAALGAATLAGSRALKKAKASSGGEKGPHQWTMVIDQSKCEGCDYCTLARRAHNDISPEIAWEALTMVIMSSICDTVSDEEVEFVMALLWLKSAALFLSHG